MFKVHIGYTSKGNDRWRKFDTLESANAFCERVRAASGLILSIVGA